MCHSMPSGEGWVDVRVYDRVGYDEHDVWMDRHGCEWVVWIDRVLIDCNFV
jgi:hypothetical protein